MPRIFWPHRFPSVRLLLCPKRTTQTAARTAERSSACSSRWTRPCFSRKAQVDPFRDQSRPGMPSSPPRGVFPFGLLPLGFKGPCVQRPNATTLQAAAPAPFSGPFGPHFASRNSRDPGRQALHPRPQPRCEVISSGALVGATGGTQTHSRRTGRKLGRLRYARQGLVRVPESNTKYGGKRGKPAGWARA